jgi:hypothetical protein
MTPNVMVSAGAAWSIAPLPARKKDRRFIL